MQTFAERVAVVTGAASGIGRAIAFRCAREGMSVVLADIEEDPLQQLAAAMRQEGAVVLPVVTDVSRADDVAALARHSWERFGAVHLLCNNAGVCSAASAITATAADWDWIMGVNLGGVANGVRAFVPRMIQQNVACHVVNTASILGLISGPGQGVYRVSKHAIIALSETLHHELTRMRARLAVSVLCPGMVNTEIANAERNRPGRERHTGESASPESVAAGRIRSRFERGTSPDEVAEALFTGIREGRFYIFTHPDLTEGVRLRLEGILSGACPTPSSGY